MANISIIKNSTQIESQDLALNKIAPPFLLDE
jgi:hypothetical protein